jgi:tetratricopeptide (TPR) repeat protein
MGRRLGRTLFLLSAWASLALATGAGQESHAAIFTRATDAYRRGAYEEAEVLWRSLLDEDLDAHETARIYYDLGNVAWRRGEALQAIGWYTSAIRLEPRHPDAWANLEFARSQAGLEPADRGDLRSTVERLLGSLRPEEARWLLLSALALFALLLALEAWRGGRLWRRLAFVGLLVVLLASAPWVRTLLREGGDPLLVIGTPSAALRSEPRASLSPVGELDPGEEVQRIDSLPGWVRVETAAGERGWVTEQAVFALPR